MRRPLPFVLVALLGAGAGLGMGLGLSEGAKTQPAQRDTGAPAPRSVHSRTPRTSVPGPTSAVSAGRFDIEPPCAGIVSSPLLRPAIDLRPELLTASDLPPGAAVDGPHETSTRSSTTFASVPTTTPAAYETATLYHDDLPGGSALVEVSEVIGDVGSASLATELLSTLETDLNSPACNLEGSQLVALPDIQPPITVTVTGGASSAGAIQSARLFTVRGSELICLTWTSQSVLNAAGEPPKPSLPALPDSAAMSRVVEAALADAAR